LTKVCDVSDTPPSSWVECFAGVITPGGRVLDLAAGSGRHTRYLLGRGHRVVAVDQDVAGLPAAGAQLEVIAANLEDGSVWPLGARRFAGIVVTNYLHRPLFGHLAAALEPGGILIYETFQRGNERLGRPSNPDFLLLPGELLKLADRTGLTVLGYFSGAASHPKPAMVQRIAARAPE
jgi:SAM-dependent methyltransferase